MTFIDLCKLDTDPEHAVSGDGAEQTLRNWQHDEEIAQEMQANGIRSNAEQFGQSVAQLQKVASAGGYLAIAS